jgi:hypothetical protein
VFGRYILISVVVLVVALATGLVVHLAAGTSDFQGVCEFQVALPATATVPSSDILVFERRDAADDVQDIAPGSLLPSVAAQTGIPIGDIAGHEQLGPSSDSTFEVVASYKTAAGASAIAQALCASYVTQVGKELRAQRIDEDNSLRARLRYLNAKLVVLNRDARADAHRPVALSVYLDERGAIDQAIHHVVSFLIVAYSFPPDIVSPLGHIATVSAHSTKPSLAKSLVVAAIAALLVIFLLVLALETIYGRRPEEAT